MMTPKDKAKYLLEKFWNLVFDLDPEEDLRKEGKGASIRKQTAKNCVMVMADDILAGYDNDQEQYKYWKEVLKELGKL